MSTIIFIISFIALYILWRYHLNQERYHLNQEKDYQNVIKGLKFHLKSLKEHHFHFYPQEWIDKLYMLKYKNEIEVEIKFVFPLMMYLGYSLDEMRIRIPVTIQAGSQSIDCIADWVITQKSENGEKKTLIEVKSPKVALDYSVRKQAKSYAIALGIPRYVITNGRQIIVFERDVINDIEIMNLYIEEFEQEWNTLKYILGSTRESTHDV